MFTLCSIVCVDMLSPDSRITRIVFMLQYMGWAGLLSQLGF